MSPSVDYEVGYKRPPKEHQFRKGQRPAGSGRRKGSRNTRTLAQMALEERFPVTRNGKTTKASVRELGIAHDQKKAAGGDWKAFERLLKLAGEIHEDSASPPQPSATVSEGDRLSLRHHFQRILEQQGLQPEQVEQMLQEFGLGGGRDAEAA